MTLYSTMQRQQHEIPITQQSRSYGHYIDSNPSSTHSSPRTYPSDLEPYYPVQHNITHSQTYPIPAGIPSNPYIPAQQRRPHPHMQPSRSSSYSSYAPPLQVSTSTSSTQELDPNERTARPGNAHLHAQFHSSLTAPQASKPHSSLSSSLSTTAGTADAVPNADSGEAPADGSSTQQRHHTDYTSSTPGLSAGLTRPLKPVEQDRLAHLDRLKFFLATAPSRWDSAAANANPASSSSVGGDYAPFGSGTSSTGPFGSTGAYSGLGIEPAYHHAPPHPALNRFLLPNQEFVTCVLWNGLYHITGTDIVRALVFRFEAFGRPVRNMKKFEEGVFSDLRNLKPGVDACLEDPKSPFLDLLFKYQCIRTQKKQKVFYWFSVPHDRLFLDALERDLKREKMGMEPTTHIVGEPALSFTYDPKRSLYEQFSKAQGAREGESELETAVRRATEDGTPSTEGHESGAEVGDSAMIDDSENEVDDGMGADTDDSTNVARKRLGPNGPHLLFTGSLFEGSPTYKQRRKKGSKLGSGLRKGSEDFQDPEYERGRSMGGASGSGRFASLSRERRVIPPPMHSSMMEEFAPNPAADQARHNEAMSAADIFHKQARGELVPGDGVVRKPKPQPIVGEVGVFYSEGAPPPPGQRLSQQGMHMRGRSFDQTSRESTQNRPLSAGYNTTTFGEAQAQSGQTPAAQAGLNAPGPMASGMAQYEAVSADGKVRAFVCPLYSCGRLFKRMEHLKRHLRTHTMERPFTCPQCSKKFSRSDNLTQHLRTHDRTGHASAPGSANGSSDWMDSGEDGNAGGEGSTSGESPQPGVVESDEDNFLQSLVGFGGMGGMEMFGDNGPFSMDISHFNMHSMAGLNMSQVDPGMCEVEVQGGVQDVQGDEEGLLMQTSGANPTFIYRNHQFHSSQPTSDEYYSGLSASSDATSGLLFSSAANSSEFPDSAQWIHRPQPSPAYSTLNAPSPPPGSIPIMRNSNRASMSGSPASFLRNMQPHPSSSSASSAYGDDYSSASLSAPSHKQSFDHVPMFPPGMLENALANNLNAGNVGPMRRHRSMTPSLIRNGEPIRRPMTANSGEFQGGSPNSINSSISSSSSAARGYHPYAYSNNNSRANSTHSSPQVHAVPLGAEYAQIRSESRNSNYGGAGGVGTLHEQMRQMMSMNVDPQNPAASSSSSIFGDNMYRTGSPASFHQTDSPAAFGNVDLPMQYPATAGYMSQQAPQQQQQQLHSAATMPVTSQYGAQQQQSQYEGYYVQQPHATL